MVKWIGPVIVVKDETASRTFYEMMLDQVLKFDFGACQQFKSGLTLQRKSSMGEIFQIRPETIVDQSHSSILYFETEDFADFISKLEMHQVQLVHPVIEFEWGQKSVSFYDPDGHVVDVSESMESVCQRLISQGMSIEQVAAYTEHGEAFVRMAMEQKAEE